MRTCFLPTKKNLLATLLVFSFDAAWLWEIDHPSNAFTRFWSFPIGIIKQLFGIGRYPDEHFTASHLAFSFLVTYLVTVFALACLEWFAKRSTASSGG